MSRKSSAKKSTQKKGDKKASQQGASTTPQGVQDPHRSPAMVSVKDQGSTSSLKNRFSFYILLAVVVAIAFLSYEVMKGFVLPLFLAALLVVIFQPFHGWLLAKCGGRQNLAAGMTTSAILLIVLAPLGWALTIGIVEGVSVSSQWGKNADLLKLDERMNETRQRFGLLIPLEDELDDVAAAIAALKAPTDVVNRAQFVESMGPNIQSLHEEFHQLKESLDQSVADFHQAAPETIPWNQLKWTERIIDPSEDPSENNLTGTGQVRLSQHWRDISENSRRLQELAKDFQDGPVTAQDVDTYESIVAIIGLDYQLARQEMLGGAARATLAEIANPSEQQIKSLQQQAQTLLSGLLLRFTGKTTTIMGSLAMQIFILSVALFYFLTDGPEMVKAAMHLSPMDDRYEKEMISEFAKLSRAVVVATLLSALAQGILAGIGYFFCWQFESLFILIILTTLLAMVPFVGAAAVWVPCCLYLALVENRVTAALLLAAYGFFVVSMADNIIKPMVLKGQSNLHPLFALLSVLGGVQALGPVGVLVGPMLVAFLQSLLKLLNRDLNAESV